MTFSTSGRLWMPPSLRQPTLASSGDIIACPGLDYCALATARSIPDRTGHLAQICRSMTASRISVRSRSTFQAASTPAAITMSATSASSASIRRARSTTRSPSAARRRRAPRSARSSGRVSPAPTCPTRSRRSSTPISKHRQPGEEFLAAYRRLGAQPFKEALYAAH